MNDEATREEIREALSNPSVELVQKLGNILQESKTPFRFARLFSFNVVIIRFFDLLRSTRQSIQNIGERRSVNPSPLHSALMKEFPDLSANAVQPTANETRVLVSPKRPQTRLENRPLPQLIQSEDSLDAEYKGTTK